MIDNEEIVADICENTSTSHSPGRHLRRIVIGGKKKGFLLSLADQFKNSQKKSFNFRGRKKPTT